MKDKVLAGWRSPRANPTKSGRGGGVGVGLVNFQAEPKARQRIFVNGIITSQRLIVPLLVVRARLRGHMPPEHEGSFSVQGMGTMMSD